MAREARNEARVRLNLDLSERTREQLEDLRKMTNADSMSEVIRRALCIYDYLWQEHLADRQLIEDSFSVRDHRVATRGRRRS